MKTVYRRKLLSLVALGALCSTFPSVGFAEAKNESPKKEISDKVSSDLAKLKEFVDAKDYPKAVQLLDTLLAGANPVSYDTAMVSQIKAQVLLTEGKYAEAIPALVTAQELGEKYSFFEKKSQLDQLYLLCQIHYQLAADAKDPARQAELFTKAYFYIHKWLETTPKPTTEGQLFAASILYGHATLIPGKPDAELLRQARAEATNGLYLTTKPADQLYVLLLASMQQLGDYKASAEILEVLVSRHPENALYWQQLAGSYLALASAATEDKEIRRLHLRTILTMQRAQSHGIMNTPKDNLNVIGMYFNLEQFGKASDLLAEGLKSGQVENIRSNWELLSSCYQQSGRDDQAIITLEKAADLFPTEGQIEYSLGQMHYGAGRIDNALVHLERAVTKGNLKKTGEAYLFLGFAAYELQKYEDAAKWAGLAAKQPDVKPESAAKLSRAVADALKEREALKTSKT